MSGNMEEMASKILSEGNFLVPSLPVRPGDDTDTLSSLTGVSYHIFNGKNLKLGNIPPQRRKAEYVIFLTSYSYRVSLHT